MDELLTGTLIKAARALLRLDQEGLAAATGVARKTIALIEVAAAGRVDPRRQRVLELLRRRMEDDMGVEFVFASDATGEGVRLRSPHRNHDS